MTTTQDLIAQLRALGIPDWAMARVLMTQAADTLKTLQAENAQWRVDFKEMVLERNAALARLAELEKQEPVIYQAKTKPGFLSTSAYAWEDCEKADFLVYEADGVHVRGLYAAAGASLVATPIVAWAKSTPRKLRITTMDMGREDGWRPLGYTAAGASPVEPSQAQPPAPSDTAITYMTGYSDGKEWVGATSQAVELSDEEQVALLRFNETCEDGQGYDVKTSMMSRLAEIGVVSRKFGSVYFVTEYGQRVIAAIKQGGQQ